MFISVVAAVALVVVVALLIHGAIGVAAGGFVWLVYGASAVALLLSLLLGSAARILLVSLPHLPADNPLMIYSRSALAALAQPTLSGIMLLALMALLALFATRVSNFVEEIQILVDSHKSFRNRGATEGVYHVNKNAK